VAPRAVAGAVVSVTDGDTLRVKARGTEPAAEELVEKD
jgi:endonuclease YncB( thermonuclease family)